MGVGFREAICRGRVNFHNVIAVAGPGLVDFKEDAVFLVYRELYFRGVSNTNRLQLFT